MLTATLVSVPFIIYDNCFLIHHSPYFWVPVPYCNHSRSCWNSHITNR